MERWQRVRHRPVQGKALILLFHPYLVPGYFYWTVGRQEMNSALGGPKASVI